jgi:protein subunit release factor B
MKNVEIDADIKKEYENQKKYLDDSVTSLKKRLEKERQIHKEEHLNIMKDNVELITEIGRLRSEVREFDEKLKKTKNNFKEEKSRLVALHGPLGDDLTSGNKQSHFLNDVTARSDN